MARSLKKGPYIDQHLMQKIQHLKPGTKAIIKTWSRSQVIMPEMIGFTFGVHNGKEHVPVQVSEDMVGHRLGEFAPTTRFSRHGGRIQKELEAKASEQEAAKISPTVKKE
ncbi:MAG: 30S ribosomal protein S19 [Candidatus Nealsonbacteria bacterium RIFCSPLOWO2_01_FULL_43_32]|uniref:Small ribosomal subunit protein uS19 n=1 Tax=Candidatus Nealsonbacteria bacterium RIFCSPLOWO2_01_FULL_43_32 TaxID=1801672 RepID=A0A1G2EGV7_9BACT|nr:MAG: 30S ribosomal protein S19 [Candidatus Nealsonbacteria bacterium RIFCSPLOWO2_01_FULL_43_32]